MSAVERIRKETHRDIEALARRGDVLGLAAIIRASARENPRVFALPAVKAWCGRRWRHLFLREAVEDQRALAAATHRSDPRPPRQRIAERYLAADQDAWRDEQPDPVETATLSTTLLLCPGLMNGLLPAREFADELPRIAWRYRMPVLRSDSHPARSCEANTTDIVRALSKGRGRDAVGNLIPADKAHAPGNVIAVCYSKGAPDMLTTLVMHPEIRDRVRCLVSWAGALGGSPLADDLVRTYAVAGLAPRAGKLRKVLGGFARWRLPKEAISRYRLDEYDAEGALRSLTTRVRRDFLAKHGAALDQMDIPIFTVRGVTSVDEVPWSQRQGAKRLSLMEAEHDMHVLSSGARLPLPMASELGVLHGHNWDIASPAFRKRSWLNNTYHPFPKTAALAATIQLAAELGLIE